MPLTIAVDNLCIYDPGFKHIADRFLAEFGGNSAIYEVDSMETLTTAVNSFRAVKFVEFVVHGKPGTISFGNFQIAGWYIAKLAETNPHFLQKNAQILFDSCSIGKGTTGDTFMDDLGAKLLKEKGGVIGATTVDNWTFPLFPGTGVYMPPFSFGRLKVKRYDANGKPVGAQQVDRHGFKR